ncbi:TonB-dependent receptor [candidate division KSB1 bacterium]|nr:TonB-dependent receptor [candidate division KSB1 bacterium]
MIQLQRITFLILLLSFLFVCSLWAGTTGKITGRVYDKETGEALPGANVIIAQTELGAAADMNGQYTILHVPPGMFDVNVSVIGYANVTVNQVRVRIDQTTHVDFALEIEAIEGETVTIVAERALLKEDVATSVVAVSDREVAELPVTDVDGVISLQAGIQEGLAIRGGTAEDALFMLDGVTLRDPRNNLPVTKIALSAVKEISLERGGFNAEYGQVQSGLVNVVTKEGGKQNYSGSITFKVSPPAPKYWRGEGIPDVYDPDSYWMRPYLDDDVCWTGTSNGAWDEYTQNQYPIFKGWNEFSKILCTDNNPDNDLTPLAAQRVFLYETRKRQNTKQGDYQIDGGLGGPIPVIGKKLGDLRFFTSYRRDREMLLFPLTRPDYVDYDWTMQLTSDITPSMKLRFSTLSGKQYTMESNWAPGYYPRWPSEIADVAAYSHQSMFSDWDFCLTDIGHQSFATKLTHTLNPTTFYEVSLEHFKRDYYTRPTRPRDTKTLYEVVPGYFRDENPFGYYPETDVGLIVGSTSHASKARDFTIVNSTTFKADFTNQINYNNLIKAGVEFVYNDLNFDYGVIASASEGKTYSNRVQMHVFPVRSAVYIQDKLEANGFTMNAGLRLDYSSSRTDWWDLNPYDQYFFSSKYNTNMEFAKSASKSQWQLSPRLGISHPITENSKLFFNYGHFKQMPQYETLFRVQRTSDRELTGIGDPNLILAKTVSYELGYDHVLYNNFLVQLAAFYKDITDQQNTTQYNSIGGIVYDKTTSNNYEDIRGFELTLRKATGRWWAGFANYTYQVNTSGTFGRERIWEDPALQKKYDEATVNLYQQRPIPRPYARANLSFYTPDEFGPSLMGQQYLGGLMLNILLDWEDGDWTTYNPKNISGVINNVKSVEWFNMVLRFTKTFKFNNFRVQFLMDVNNALNTLRLTNTNDEDYRASLHFPKNKAYDNIPGDDKIGDYRKPGAEFQPMERRQVINRETDIGKDRVIYYEGSTGEYLVYMDNTWSSVNKSRLNKILDDKAYIDMPNASTFWFLNPRQFFYGIRFYFDLK